MTINRQEVNGENISDMDVRNSTLGLRNNEYDWVLWERFQINIDDNSVDTVIANITLPGGAVQQVTLTNAGGNQYNATYTIP